MAETDPPKIHVGEMTGKRNFAYGEGEGAHFFRPATKKGAAQKTDDRQAAL